MFGHKKGGLLYTCLSEIRENVGEIQKDETDPEVSPAEFKKRASEAIKRINDWAYKGMATLQWLEENSEKIIKKLEEEIKKEI